MKGYKQGTRKVIIKCVKCDASFERYISRQAKYCSHKCFLESGNAHRGKKHSQETIESLRLDGRTNPGKAKTWFKPEHRLWDHPNVRASWIKSGSKPSNWLGGKRWPSEIIKDDPRYKVWRRAVFNRDGYVCQICGVGGVYIEADHIKPKSKYPNLAFDLNNGRTLCKPCHQNTPTYGSKALKA